MSAAALKNCLVTGGSGFLGAALVRALAERGCAVRAFDITPPDDPVDGVTYLTGDIRTLDDVAAACEGIDTVFHTAAVISTLGGRAATEKYRLRARSINVDGTRNVLAACQRRGVKRLIYISSNVVCFSGAPNPGMNARTPYTTRWGDLYTETKLVAERAVLDANGVGGVLTCAIRPSGIWGPGKGFMFERFIEQLAAGRLVMNIGSPDSVQDNTYVDNAVHGALLAAQHLVPGSTACGNAYFIVDDEPMNYFEFFRPLTEGLGHAFPRFWIPMWVLVPVVSAWQWLHFRLGLPPPFMSPSEVKKISVTHYSTIDDARDDLGYTPVVSTAEGMQKSLEYLRPVYDRLVAERGAVTRPHPGWWGAVFTGMFALALIAFNDAAGAWFQESVPILGAMPIGGWRIVFWIAVALHVGEGLYAWWVARAAGLKRAGGWAVQTFLLGWPSTRLLRAAVHRREAAPIR